MNILLGITGSIAAYKAYDLCRDLSKASYTVKVVLSKGALKFIKKETFYYLGAKKVFSPEDDFTPQNKDYEGSVLHISLKDWMDRMVIYPLSANSLSNMAHGKADDLLQSVLLAGYDKPKLLFPAMNSKMLENPITQNNLKLVKNYPNTFIADTDTGELVCGENGDGKLLKPDTAISLISTVGFTPIRKQEILISTGATKSELDPIRFLTNPASGKTGIEISKAFLKDNFKVTLLIGEDNIQLANDYLPHPNLKVIPLKENKDFYDFIRENGKSYQCYISSAAFTDIKFQKIDQKLKKENFKSVIPIQKDIDVLEETLKLNLDAYIIGFAAETFPISEDPLPLAKEKIKRKPVDLLVVNSVASKQGFKANSNQYYLLSKNNSEFHFQGRLSKKELGEKLKENFLNATF